MARRTFPKEAGERVTLQARTTTRVRDRLEEAARESGRSLSQEMEMRLHESLLIEDVAERMAEKANEKIFSMVDTLGGPITYSLLRDLSEVIQCVETHLGEDWYSSADTKAFLYKALEAVLPAAIRADRKKSDAHDDPLFRTIDLINRLPFRPKSQPSMPMPEGMRFATEEELKDIFFLKEDNAGPAEVPAKRRRAIRMDGDK